MFPLAVTVKGTISCLEGLFMSMLLFKSYTNNHFENREGEKEGQSETEQETDRDRWRQENIEKKIHGERQRETH